MRTGDKALHERLYEEAEKKKKDLQLMVCIIHYDYYVILVIYSIRM